MPGENGATLARKRTAQCPECGEMFSPQGLSGHLRQRHGLTREQAAEKMQEATATASVPDKADLTLRIIGQIRSVRDEIEAVGQEQPKEGRSDPVLDQCLQALQRRELELVNRLRELDEQKPMVETMVPAGMFSKPRRELVEAGGDEGPSRKSKRGPLDF